MGRRRPHRRPECAAHIPRQEYCQMCSTHSSFSATVVVSTTRSSSLSSGRCWRWCSRLPPTPLHLLRLYPAFANTNTNGMHVPPPVLSPTMKQPNCQCYQFEGDSRQIRRGQISAHWRCVGFGFHACPPRSNLVGAGQTLQPVHPPPGHTRNRNPMGGGEGVGGRPPQTAMAYVSGGGWWRDTDKQARAKNRARPKKG